MAESNRYLTQRSHDRLKRTVEIVLGAPPRSLPARRNLISPGDPQIVRLGKLYGGVAAAVYDGSGTLTQAKKCEVLLHRIRADGSQMEDFETDPEVAYSIVDATLADGAEVLCLRDRSINDPANENVAQPGWIVIQAVPGGGSNPERQLYVCGSSSLVVANSDGNQQIKPTTTYNFDPTTFQVNVADWTITLKRAGYYEVRHDFVLEAYSATGTHAFEAATGYFRNAETLGAAVIDCSRVLMRATTYDTNQGFVGSGQTFYAYSPGDQGATPWKIDWVAQRVTFNNGMSVDLEGAHLRWFGTTAPTNTSFDAP